MPRAAITLTPQPALGIVAAVPSIGWHRMRMTGHTSWSSPRPRSQTHPVFIACLAVAPTIVGCAERVSRMAITDYREPGLAARYQETFDEAYYDIDALGNVDVVLVRGSVLANDNSDRPIQVVHIRSFWRPIPGRTVTHRTQINGTVTYYITSGSVGATFEGAGSVFFKRNKRLDTLSGSLDLARLKPVRRLTQDGAIFRSADITGEFHAVRDRRRLVRIIHEMDRRFAPTSMSLVE